MGRCTACCAGCRLQAAYVVSTAPSRALRGLGDASSSAGAKLALGFGVTAIALIFAGYIMRKDLA